ncbi:MAG: hypothetical protein CL844_03245 [Crocinitomicaceae bacterium]|nr:hypothetical protein [Crocinitomicaceae bacterium]|tara:strand:+ start:72215 stop:73456 length:1242 start_codon:yes stop_codon:yes gene_type:complete
MKVINLFLAIIISFYNMSQNYVAPFANKGLWGYVLSNGNVLINNIYKHADPFNDGLAFVFNIKSKRWMIIDKYNNEINVDAKNYIPKNYFGFGRKGFIDSLAQIRVKNKFACINTKGKFIHKAEYDKLSEFKDGFAIGRIDQQFYLLGKKGEKIKINGSINGVNYVKNGYAPFKNKEGNFGFIDTKGEIIIPAKFENVGYFYNNLAWARKINGKIGFININGDWVIEPVFDKVTNFEGNDKIASVKKEDRWIFLRASGETFEIKNTIAIGKFNNERCWVKTINNKVGFIDKKGNWIVEPKYEAAKNFEYGLSRVKKNGLWGLINTSGEIIADCIYKKIGKITEYPIEILRFDLWGFINHDGSILVEPKYSDTRTFKENYAAVRTNNKWGLIDIKGKEVIKPKYLKFKSGSSIE